MTKPIELVKTLMNNGYKVIPVNSKGVPRVSGHMAKGPVFSEQDADGWERDYPTNSVAMVCGYNKVVALDFDIDDPKVSKLLRREIAKYFPRCPIRTSGSERFACFFRADDSITKYKNMVSKTFRFEDDINNQIEMIGYGLITLHGAHRKTKNLYKWEGRKLTDTKHTQLPLLKIDRLEKLFKFFYRQYSKYIKVADESKSGEFEELTFDNATHIPREYTDEEIDLILEKIDGSGRTQWRNVGMALHEHHNGSAEGLERWNEWSRGFSGYRGTHDQTYQWGSFKTGGRMCFDVLRKRLGGEGREIIGDEEDVSVDVRSLTPEEALEYMVDNYVFIEDTNEVGDVGAVNDESVLPLQNRVNSHLNQKITTEKELASGEMKEDKVPVMKMWQANPDRRTAFGKVYMPGGPRFVYQNSGKKKGYYNNYVKPTVSLTNDDHHLPLLLEHMAYLFPKGGDEWMSNWIAQIVQNPEMRHRTAPLSISLYQRTGRGWMTDFFRKLLGGSNVTTLAKLQDMTRPGAKTGWLNDSLLCVVNEVFLEKDKRFTVMEHLKTIISDNYQEIDIKYGKQTYGQKVYTRIFLQSNHLDGMVIEDDDTRIQPFVNSEYPKSNEYYDTLYDLLQDESGSNGNEFMNQAYSYFMRYKVDVDRLVHSEHTKDREAVILSNKSPEAVAFYEFKHLVKGNIFTDEMLFEFVSRYRDEHHSQDLSSVNTRAFHVLKKKITNTTTVRVGQKYLQVLSFKPLKGGGKNEILDGIQATKDLIQKHYDELEKE